MGMLTGYHSKLLAQAKAGNLFSATELTRELIPEWWGRKEIDPEVFSTLEACRDIIAKAALATSSISALGYCLTWLMLMIRAKLVPTEPVENALISGIESINDEDMMLLGKSYRDSIPEEGSSLSKKVLEKMFERLCDIVAHAPVKRPQEKKLFVLIVSRALDDSNFSDDLFQESERAVLDSGDLHTIHQWDDLINNQGIIKKFLATIERQRSPRHDETININDVPLNVTRHLTKGTPFEKNGLVVINGKISLRNDINDVLWWIDPDSFEADHVCDTSEWHNFFLNGCKPVNGMLPAPISVRETGEWPWPEQEKKMKKEESKLREFVNLIIERKMREADHSSGGKVPFGSSKHVKDLEKRIKELSTWREKHKKGSEKRAHYARLISTLRQELGNARKAAEKRKKK